MRKLARALALMLLLLPLRAWAPYGVPGGAGGVSSATCTAPLACSPATGATAFTWTGASLSGTPAAGDLSCWNGANSETLITNASGSASKVLTWAANACPTWSAAAGGGGALSAITAATGANTIASNNNTGQVWNWANTADSTVAFTFGETAAATNGTSTAGVPNQALLKLTTAAASTQSPLTVYSRGSHVFSVSPSTTQIFSNAGSGPAPAYSFAGNAGTGMSLFGTAVLLSANGASQLYVTTGGISVNGSVTDVNSSNTGIDWPDSIAMRIFNGTDGEWVRFISRVLQVSRGSADATAFALNSRKSRGTVAAPTVITTGDALLTESGYGYVGATNTYREATRIEHDSTGTIADATTGIGGSIKFQTAKAGTDTAPQTNLTITGGSTGSVTIASGTTLNPAQVAGIVGTTTNNAAQAGSVGELITATAAANAVSLTTNTAANVTSVSLTAGDWDCTGTINFTFGATTSVTNLTGGASQTSATLPTQDLRFDNETAAQVPTATAVAAYPIPTAQELLAGTTTVFLVAQATFTVSTIGAGGTLRCRRIR